MHHLLTIIKQEGYAAQKTICERYSPNYQFSFTPGRYIVLNSELLSSLLTKDPTCGVLEALREGCEAYDTRTLKPVDVVGADPLHVLI